MKRLRTCVKAGIADTSNMLLDAVVLNRKTVVFITSQMLWKILLDVRNVKWTEHVKTQTHSFM